MKKIEFFSTIDGVSDVAPIIEAKDLKMPWIEKTKQDYKQRLAVSNGETFFHVARCPAIMDLLQTGYIISSFCDIAIETIKDRPDGFSWIIPNSDLTDLMFENENCEIIQNHSLTHGTTAKYVPQPPNTLETVIKINTPWHMVVPKGMKVLMLPVPYTENFAFTACSGIWEPSMSSNINIQLYWNNLDGKYFIKAGTPLAHLILLSDEKFEFECRDANEKDKKWLKKRKYFQNMSFMLKRNILKTSYDKHFNQESKCPFHKWFK